MTFAHNMAGLSQAVAEAFDEPVQFNQLGKLLEYVYRKAGDQKVILVIDEYPFLRADYESIDSEFQIAIDGVFQKQPFLVDKNLKRTQSSPPYSA